MTETVGTARGIETRLNAYVNALNSGTISDRHHFTVTKGRKYYKVIDSHPTDSGPLAGASVHAFVETATGDVFKPAGWARPAEHVRYRLMDDVSYVALLRHAGQRDAFAGGYLYIR